MKKQRKEQDLAKLPSVGATFQVKVEVKCPECGTVVVEDARNAGDDGPWECESCGCAGKYPGDSGPPVVRGVPVPSDGSVAAITDTLNLSLTAFDDCVKKVREQLTSAKTYDTRLASHLIYLMEGGARVLGELRKMDAAAKKAVKNLSPDEAEELLRGYVMEMQPARFRAFREWINALEETK